MAQFAPKGTQQVVTTVLLNNSHLEQKVAKHLGNFERKYLDQIYNKIVQYGHTDYVHIFTKKVAISPIRKFPSFLLVLWRWKFFG